MKIEKKKIKKERNVIEKKNRYWNVVKVVKLIGRRRVGKTVIERNAIKWFGRQYE